MGLGKTIQVIRLLYDEQKAEEKAIKIICPASMVYNWESEFREVCPIDKKSRMVAGTAPSVKQPSAIYG